METLRYEHKFAKRDHKSRCEMTGLRIEKGDRFFEGAWKDGYGLSHIKALSIVQEMAVANLHPDETWSPSDAPEYLICWLREQFGHPTFCRDDLGGYGGRVEHPDVEACYIAARAFWACNPK